MSISCPALPCGKTSDQPGQGISRSRGGLPLVICPHVLGNPIKYNDPTGHVSFLEGDPLIDPPKMIMTLNVNLSDSIGKNILGAQYYEYGGNTYYNLCGHVAVDIILGAASGKSGNLDDLIEKENHWNILTETDTGTSGDQLGSLLKKFLPPGWMIIVYNEDKYERFISGGKTSEVLELGYKWWEDPAGNYCLVSTIQGWLNQGNYIIVSVYLDPETGQIVASGGVAHWVVVVGY